MINNYYVFDDLISKKYQDEIENMLLKDIQFPWYFTPNIFYFDKNTDLDLLKENFYGFMHIFKNEKGRQSMALDFLLPLMYTSCDKISFDLKNVLNVKSLLQLPNTKENNNCHSNILYPNLFLLYYVNDSQGSTTLYEEIFPDVLPEDSDPQKLTIKAKIESKKGRIVLFNGLGYYSSPGPESGARCIINFNLS